MLACANPLTAPSQPANVETVVAATISALTAPADGSAAPSTPVAGDSSSSLLPRSLYYLANDAAQIPQVFRMERDGKTITQLTFEPANVEDFDVSQADGSIVFLSNHQLFLANADGSNRRMIFDAGPQDEVNPFLTRVISPVFSPNGQTVTFGYKGLNFYSVASGQSNRVLEDRVNEGNGFMIPEELYWPEMYSADGSKLIITLGYYEGASAGIYNINANALTRLDDSAQRAIICCGDYSISTDSSSLYAGSSTFGMFAAGLWRVDTNTGNVSTLLLGDFDTNPAEVADNPFIAPDGQLYYFYASVPNTGDMVSRPPLQLVRSAADGVTGRTVIRPETFTSMNEALWTPDASFVIVANAQNEQLYFGGAAELYYTDGQKAMIPILPYAQSLKWGP
jgi:Tol biopolymer transport system component